MHPRLSTNCLLSTSPSAAAGRFDADAVAGLEVAGAFGRYVYGSRAADDGVAAGPSVVASVEAVGRACAAVGEERHARGHKRLNLSQHPVAASLSPAPARAAAQ